MNYISVLQFATEHVSVSASLATTALQEDKRSLHARVVPFICVYFYNRGIQNWGKTNGFLTDTCLMAQDNYKDLLNCFQIKF